MLAATFKRAHYRVVDARRAHPGFRFAKAPRDSTGLGGLWAASGTFRFPRVSEDSRISDLDSLVAEFGGTRLSISEIRYGSPGFQDFFGIAKVVEELLKFINGLIRIGIELQREKLNIEKQKLDIEMQRETIVKMRIDNADSLLRTLRDNGFSESNIQSALAKIDPYQILFVRLVQEGKITAAIRSDMSQAA
jgi:hypothetical protein